MATSKSTAKPDSIDSDPNRPAPSVPVHLRMIALELHCALSTVSVAARALLEQNADLDADVALVLQRGAGAPIHASLERIEQLLDELGAGNAADKEEPENGMH